MLLRMEELVKRIDNQDTEAFDGSSSQTTSSGGMGAPVASSGVKGAADELEELRELRWKIGKLMEIFLSNELQVCAKWRVHRAKSNTLKIYPPPPS